jgi:1,4-alpha-glucan branching enzyme
LETSDGELVDRLCPWSRFVQRADQSNIYHGVFYHPSNEQTYHFQYPNVEKRQRLKIYEAHIGISSAREEIATYEHFRRHILPRIVQQGQSIALLN